MAEGIGLSLGVVSLYTVCTFVYEQVTTEPMTAKAATFSRRLQLQSSRFRLWGDCWGVYDEAIFERRLNAWGDGGVAYDDVRNALAQIVLLFARTYKFEERYQAEILPKLKELQGDWRAQGSAGFKAARRFLKSSSLKFAWSIGDKNKFQEMVQELTELNNDLDSILPASLNPRSFQYRFAASYFSNTSLDGTADDTDDDFIAIVSDFKRLTSKLEQLANNPSAQRASREPLLKGLENFGQKLTHPNLMQFLQTSLEKNPRDVTALHSIEPVDNRTFAMFDGAPVVIEFKPYTPDIADTIRSRVQALAFTLAQTPKPEGFCFLDCVGWYRDQTPNFLRYVLLYSYPREADLTQKPVSLASLLADEHRISPLPSLGQRFKLAHALAIGCMSLLLIEWVHKGIRPHNVLFFHTKATENQPSRIWFENPFIVGFDYARPNLRGGPVQISNERADMIPEYNLYRHKDVCIPAAAASQAAGTTKSPGSRTVPQGVRPPSKPYYDIYALVLILLEIGLWRPIRRIYGKDCQQWDDPSFSAFNAKMEESSGNELAHRMGIQYRDAVSPFFRNPSAQALDSDEKVWFWERLVAPLGRCADSSGADL
jgi:hypothetical protein